MRPLLVGESNPYGSDPRFALYPLPERSAGGRLCRLVLGMRMAEYLRAYDRANLCDGRWSAPTARSEAARLATTRAAPIVLLGARVASAFALDFEPFTDDPPRRVRRGGLRLRVEPGRAARARGRAGGAAGARRRARGRVRADWEGVRDPDQGRAPKLAAAAGHRRPRARVRGVHGVQAVRPVPRDPGRLRAGRVRGRRSRRRAGGASASPSTWPSSARSTATLRSGTGTARSARSGGATRRSRRRSTTSPARPARGASGGLLTGLDPYQTTG